MTEHQQKVQSVVIAHEILQALGNEKHAVSLATLARAVNMTPTRVLRHLTTLLELKLVEREGTEPVYRLGFGLVQLAERAASQQDVVRTAYPILSTLKEQLGEASFLVRPQRANAVIWLSFQSDDVPHLTMPPGMEFSMSASACGRAMLAFLDLQPPESEFGEEISAFFPDPMAGPDELKRRLREVRSRFYDLYGIHTGGAQSALYGLGAPILDHREQAIGAIGMAGFAVNFRNRKAVILQGLLSAAARISSQMGSRCTWPTLESLDEDEARGKSKAQRPKRT